MSDTKYSIEDLQIREVSCDRIIVHFPLGTSIDNQNEEISNEVIALNILNILNISGVAIPDISPQPKWFVTFITKNKEEIIE